MPRFAAVVALVCLAFGGPARAQSGAESASTGTLRGMVSAVDWPRGTVSIGISGASGADRTVVLNARPADLVGLSPGDAVTAPYADYAGLLWLAPDGPPAGPDPDAFGSSGTLTGAVSGVDKARGLVSVGGARLRAHPEDLEDLLPGMFVSVTWADIGGVRWLANLQAPGAEPPQEAPPDEGPTVRPARGRPGRGSPAGVPPA